MDHISIGSINYEKSVNFYKETLKILYKHVKWYEGVYPPIIKDQTVHFKGCRFTNFIFEDGTCFSVEDALYGISDDHVQVGSVKGQHIAFKAKNLKDISAWHKKACKLGAKDNGLPGTRPLFGPDYIGGFVIDLDGYRIEACKNNYIKRYQNLTKQKYHQK